jgi:hypothetical protein
VKVAQGDVVGFGDRFERQLRIRKMMFKPGLDGAKACSLHDLIRAWFLMLRGIKCEGQHIHQLVAEARAGSNV